MDWLCTAFEVRAKPGLLISVTMCNLSCLMVCVIIVIMENILRSYN